MERNHARRSASIIQSPYIGFYALSNSVGDPKVPQSAFNTDAGYDLFLSRPAVIGPYEFVDVHTDLVLAMNSELWARITGRSSTIRKYGLHIQEGVIDPGYRGELFIGVKNLNPTVVELPVHTRIAQLIFHHRVSVQWHELDRLEDLPQGERGNNGFGSTGN